MDYQKQGQDFLVKTGTEMTVKFLRNGKHFADDEQDRDIYKITLTRGRRSYSFKYGQSIVNSAKVKDVLSGREYSLDGKSAGNHSYTYLKPSVFPRNEKESSREWKFIAGTKPTAYDVLTCLTKSDPGTFEDFCSEFGYDEDSKRADRTYNAVVQEYLSVTALFSDAEMEELMEIN